MTSLSRIAWTKLADKQKYQRKLALEVLRLMRGGQSLTSATKETGFSKFLSQKHLGKNIFKKHGRLIPTITDSIQRSMSFYDQTEGHIFIIVRNSKDASTIGEYFANVRKALETGDDSYLKKFKRKSIIDAHGKKHKFETDLDKIYDLEEEIEEPEFREIYEETEI